MSNGVTKDVADRADALAPKLGFRPLTIPERTRRYLDAKRAARGDLLIQPKPEGVSVISTTAKAGGFTHDVLLTLEALRIQAEAGNRIALFIYEQECRSLGIRPAKILIPG